MNKQRNTSPFYFDDCHICQSTKKAEEERKSLSAEELTEVFKEANRRNRLARQPKS